MLNGYAFHSTVRGSVHSTNDKPCQDSSLSVHFSDVDAFAFAVADGHGDETCARSELGSRFAVEVACDKLHELALASFSSANESSSCKIDAGMIVKVKASIVSDWNDRVLSHYYEHPMSDEFDHVHDEAIDEHVFDNPAYLYGTTLVAGLLTDKALLLLQQGDGFCAVVSGSGEVTYPVPIDVRCVGNATTSMCNSDATTSMRHALIDLHEAGLVACYAGSDGIENSISGDDHLGAFLIRITQSASDLLYSHELEAHLAALLEDFSQNGSGDDSSLAGYVSPEATKKASRALGIARRHYLLSDELKRLNAKKVSMRRMKDYFERTLPDTEKDRIGREEFFASYRDLENRIQAVSLELGFARSQEQRGSLNTTVAGQQLTHKAECDDAKVREGDIAEVDARNRHVGTTIRRGRDPIKIIMLSSVAVALLATSILLISSVGGLLGRAPKESAGSIFDSSGAGQDDEGNGDIASGKPTTVDYDEIARAVEELPSDLSISSQYTNTLEEKIISLSAYDGSLIRDACFADWQCTLKDFTSQEDGCVAQVEVHCGDVKEALRTVRESDPLMADLGSIADIEKAVYACFDDDDVVGFYHTLRLRRDEGRWHVTSGDQELCDKMLSISGYVEYLEMLEKISVAERSYSSFGTVTYKTQT